MMSVIVQPLRCKAVLHAEAWAVNVRHRFGQAMLCDPQASMTKQKKPGTGPGFLLRPAVMPGESVSTDDDQKKV